MKKQTRPILPVIFGISRAELTKEEYAFFKEAHPYGFILFARNIRDKKQLLSLTQSLKRLTNDDDCPIFIDQEGGRVQRLAPSIWHDWPALGEFGDLYAQATSDKARQDCLKSCYDSHFHMAQSLKAMGINVNCVPVLDLRLKGAHNIIGDRAISDKAEEVIAMARMVIKAHEDAGVKVVIKHIPGHGRAMLDSHHDLPVIDASKAELREHDFKPFKAFANAPYAMTAHILYQDFDKKSPATLSKIMIGDVIRDEIGYRGVLISDDICMKALQGQPQDIARQALLAGIDVVLHCNGHLDEMKAITKALTKHIG